LKKGPGKGVRILADEEENGAFFLHINSCWFIEKRIFIARLLKKYKEKYLENEIINIFVAHIDKQDASQTMMRYVFLFIY